MHHYDSWQVAHCFQSRKLLIKSIACLCVEPHRKSKVVTWELSSSLGKGQRVSRKFLLLFQSQACLGSSEYHAPSGFINVIASPIASNQEHWPNMNCEHFGAIFSGFCFCSSHFSRAGWWESRDLLLQHLEKEFLFSKVTLRRGYFSGPGRFQEGWQHDRE